MYRLNSDLAYHLETIATEKYENDNYYGGRAVENASRVVRVLDYPISNLTDFTILDGIGDKIHEMIEQYLEEVLPTIQYDVYEEVDGSTGKFHRNAVLSSMFTRLFKTCIYAGSYRRGNSRINDVDILTTDTADEVRASLESNPGIAVRLYGGDKKIRIRSLITGIEADVLIVEDPDTFHSFMLHATGPVTHNIRLRRIAKSLGWTLNQYGLYDEEGNLIPTRSEADIYMKLGYEDVIEPKDRC